MTPHLRSIAMFATMVSIPFGLTAAQVAAPVAKPAQSPSASEVAPYAATVPAPLPAAPVILPPPLWALEDAEELVAFIGSVGTEGLDPRDYDADGLTAALRSGDPLIVSRAATERFNTLSSDLALGHVRGDDRQDWHVVDNDIDGNRQALLLAGALDQHRVSDALRGLLPLHPQYGALKNALTVAKKSDAALINRIKLNMDRWRWLPRDLGNRYIIVNVPAFHATLVEDGVTRWKHRAIAGSIKTPTPNLSAMATGVILNPWWEVPNSIAKEVAGKKGYVAVRGENGKVQRWRQPPGPSNALGRIKFVMGNPHAIYLHDTNARGLFDARARALSHGCIRTEKIMDLASELLADDGGEWTQDKIDAALASKKSVQANFVKPLPVYIVYFSSAALVDGRIVDYSDIYKRDDKVIAALLNRTVAAPTPKVATN